MPRPTLRMSNASVAALRQAVALDLIELSPGGRWYVIAESPAGIRQQLHTGTGPALYKSLPHVKRSVQRLAGPAVVLQIHHADPTPTPTQTESATTLPSVQEAATTPTAAARWAMARVVADLSAEDSIDAMNATLRSIRAAGRARGIKPPAGLELVADAARNYLRLAAR
jgi:hypothetical protein